MIALYLLGPIFAKRRINSSIKCWRRQRMCDQFESIWIRCRHLLLIWELNMVQLQS